MNFIGRDHEIAAFRRLRNKTPASLVVCRGRRRIGKSTFVAHCAERFDHFLVFEGLPPRQGQSRSDQLNAFAERLALSTPLPKLALDSWPQAFQLLSSALPAKGKTVLLLDELSWMAKGDPDFAGHVKAAWDNDWSKRKGLVVVLCGSVSAWIERNILRSSGFVGRVTQDFTLRSLPLADCAAFWRSKSVSAREKLTLMSVTGGVPRYLEEIDPGRSAEQNIARMCFEPGALLVREFDDIFSDVFGRRAAAHRKIVKALVAGPASVQQISKTLKQGRGGTLSDALDELHKAGFVATDVGFDPLTGETRRTVRHRLADNYLRFFLKYLAPKKRRIEDGLLRDVQVDSLSGWATTAGLQVENLVLQSTADLWRATGLEAERFENVGPYWQGPTQRRQGCQIDLLARRDGRVYVFEIKFRRKIATTVVRDVQEKVRRLKLPRTVSVRTGLIFEGELPPSVSGAGYFDHMVPMSTLLAR